MSDSSITKEQFLEYIDNLTVLELSKLIKEMEERYGVSAAAPVAAGAVVAAPAEGAEEEKAEEQTEFTVHLASYDEAKKIAVLKEVRAVTGLGLKEVKELVEGVPSVIKEGVTKEQAQEIAKKLEAVGAKTEIK